MNTEQPSFKIVAQLDSNGVFICPVQADANPRSPGAYLIPGGAVDLPVPEVPAGHQARLVGSEFVIEPVPAPAEPEVPESVPPAPPTAADLQRAAVKTVQAALDTMAATRGYDGILSLCTYAASANPKFAAEGAAGVSWRDAVWTALYEYQEQVQAGEVPAPTTIEEAQTAAIAVLPLMSWPTASGE